MSFESPINRLKSTKNKLKLITTPKQRQEKGTNATQQRSDGLISTLSLELLDHNFDYNFGPGIPFYKFLAHRSNSDSHPRLTLNIPHTLIFNDSMVPVWIYTAVDGKVYRIESFSSKLVEDTLIDSEENTIVVVVKRPQWSNALKKYVGLTTSVLNREDFKRGKSLNIKEPIVVQKFVKAKGPVPFVCRAFLKKHGQCVSYMISNKASYLNNKLDKDRACLTSIKKKDSCNIVKCTSGSHFKDTQELLDNIANFLEFSLGVEVFELVGDFTKDENGKWWFLTCKYFSIGNSPPNLQGFIVEKPYYSSDSDEESVKVNTPEKRRLRRCKLCQIYFKNLPQQLTIKMINKIDQSLKQRGINIDYFGRGEFKHSGYSTIYQNFKVCHDCYLLYETTEELNEIQSKFKEVFCMPAKIHQEGLSLNFHRYLRFYRLLVIFEDIHEVKDFKRVDLEFECCGLYTKFGIFPSKSASTVPVHKFRIFQFYANSWKDLRSYLDKNPVIKVKVLKKTQEISSTQLEIKDFENPIVKQKQYFKLLPSYGYLNCKIAVSKDHKVNVTRLKLYDIGGIYLNTEDLILPLPEEWMSLLPDVNEYTVNFYEKYGIQLNSVEDKDSRLRDELNSLQQNPLSSLRISEKEARIWVIEHERCENRIKIRFPKKYPLKPPEIVEPPMSEKDKNSLHIEWSKKPNIRDHIIKIANSALKNNETSRNHRLIPNSKEPKFTFKVQSPSNTPRMRRTPRSCENKTTRRHSSIFLNRSISRIKLGSLWSLGIQVFAVSGLSEFYKWKLVFEIFASIYGSSQISNKNGNAMFNISKDFLFKGERKDIVQVLTDETITFKVYNDIEVGTGTQNITIERKNPKFKLPILFKSGVKACLEFKIVLHSVSAKKSFPLKEFDHNVQLVEFTPDK